MLHFFKKHIEKYTERYGGCEKSQWKQATEISGNNNRMTNAQRNSLMEQTFARFKQICVTTQQLRTTIRGIYERCGLDIKSNAGSNGQ